MPPVERTLIVEVLDHKFFNQIVGLLTNHLDTNFLHAYHGIIIPVVVLLLFEIFTVRVLRHGNAQKVIVASICFETEFFLREVMKIGKMITQCSINLEPALNVRSLLHQFLDTY